MGKFGNVYVATKDRKWAKILNYQISGCPCSSWIVVLFYFVCILQLWITVFYCTGCPTNILQYFTVDIMHAIPKKLKMHMRVGFWDWRNIWVCVSKIGISTYPRSALHLSQPADRYEKEHDKATDCFPNPKWEGLTALSQGYPDTQRKPRAMTYEKMFEPHGFETMEKDEWPVLERRMEGRGEALDMNMNVIVLQCQASLNVSGSIVGQRMSMHHKKRLEQRSAD